MGSGTGSSLSREDAVEPIRILHVDDEPDLADLAATLLEREDERFSVETATDVGEGLSRLASGNFDCIVSDYDMPGRNGIEFLEAVRERYPDLPFVLFTGKGSEEIASDAISAGVTDYLQKERGDDQYAILANRIANYVNRARIQRDRQRQLDAIETAQEGISILDEDGYFVYVNGAYADLYGYDPEELVGEHWELLYRDEDVPHIQEDVLATVEERGRWQGTTTGVRADGSTFLEDHVLAKTAEGELICTVRDVTDREALQQRYELVARASTDAFWEWDPDTDEVTRYDEYLTQFGYDPSDVEDDADWWRRRIHPEDRDRVLAALDRAVEDPSTRYDETYRFRRADGTYGYLRSRGYVDYDADGEPVRVVGAHIDVTESKESEQALEKLQQRTQTLMHTTTKQETARVAVEFAHEVLGAPLSGCHVLSDDGRSLEPVASVDAVREELGDSPTYDRTDGTDPTSAVVWEVFESGEPLVVDDTSEYERLAGATPIGSAIVHPLAEHGVLIVSATEPDAFTDTDKALVDILATSLATALDRTEREQEYRRQNERLEEFTSVVSHDLRNPLNVAAGRIDLAAEDCDSDHLGEAEEALDRMEALVDDLLALARQGEVVEAPEPVQLDAVVREARCSIVADELELTVEDATLLADEDRLVQVFENLLQNAVEHATSGQSQDDAERDGEGVTVRVGLLDDGQGFYVADDGPGIPPDAREQIFEHGYTTSERGTGFGLSIVREIVEAHGWTIAVAESEAGGARFEVSGVTLD